MKKEMIAMLLAGGQGSRLGLMTKKLAKPAVTFGGKYHIIDFPLSNCINSGIDTVGILTQYRPLFLNSHIGIGSAWDLDRRNGGVAILSPYEQESGSDWYSGTANAIYQNLEFMEGYDPDYVLILSGDHIYKMDYEQLLDYHKANNADITIATMPVPWEEASRFGIVVTDDAGRITAFEEKPEHPSSNLASMGIYIFSWKVLKEALLTLKSTPNCDFGKHVIPYVFNNDGRIFSYEFSGYWKDVGTLDSYWQANMELVDLIPEFNLYEDYWKIYTNSKDIRPSFFGKNAFAERSIISEGCEVYGSVYHSLISENVVIEEGAEVNDSIVLFDCVIKKGAKLNKAILSHGTVVGEECVIGEGEFAPNSANPKVYNSDLTLIGEYSEIPDGVHIGRNCAVMGAFTKEEIADGYIPSGSYIVKGGEE